MIRERGEQRQHISLSHHAHEILLSDISAFSEKGRLSGIINTILKNYMDISEANISHAVTKKRERLIDILLTQKQSSDAKVSIAEKRTIEYLINDYRDSLIAKYVGKTFPKEHPFKLRLQNEIFDSLNDGFPDMEIYQTIGNYIKAIVEDYCMQDHYRREEIYFRSLYERLQAELMVSSENRSLLHIRSRVGKGFRDFRIKPYRISYASESQFHYLVALSKEIHSNSDVYIPAAFRLSRIESIKRTPSYGSAKITHKEEKAVENAIKEKGVPFLLSEVYDYQICLTPYGVTLYNTILHLRPMADASKTSIDNHGNVTLHFRSTSRQVLSYFFQFGKDAKIISPIDEREVFINNYRSALNQYS